MSENNDLNLKEDSEEEERTSWFSVFLIYSCILIIDIAIVIYVLDSENSYYNTSDVIEEFLDLLAFSFGSAFVISSLGFAMREKLNNEPHWKIFLGIFTVVLMFTSAMSWFIFLRY